MRTVLLSLADQRRSRTDSHGIIGFSLGLAASLPAALPADLRLVVVVNPELEPELDRASFRPGDAVVVVPAPRTALHRLWSDHVGAVRRERGEAADVAIYPKGFLPLRGAGSVRRVACIHDDIPLRQRGDGRLPLRRRVRAAYFGALLVRSVRRAALRLYVSDLTARRLARHEPRGAASAVVQEGLLVPAHEPLPLADRRREVLLLGSPHPHKGTAAGLGLVEGSPVLRGAVDRARVVGHLPADERRGLPLAHEAGPIPSHRLARRMAEARVLLFPSTDEGFGLPPLEALAMGTPVLYARTPASDETLTGVPGAFDPHDRASFEAAAEAALALDDADLATLAAAVRARFDWSITATRVADAVAGLLAQA